MLKGLLKNISELMFILITLVFFNGVVNAEGVAINQVTLTDKSDSVVEVSPPTYSGLNINFDLKLYKVNDYATYRISIQNNSNEDVLFQNKGILTSENNDYITYEYQWTNDDSVIKANSTREFDLKITYTKAVDETSFNESGVFTNNQVVKLDIATNINDQIPIVNPNTSDSLLGYILLGITLLIIVFDLGYYFYTKKYNKPLNKYILVIPLIILMGSMIIKFSYAYKVVTISINANINIKKLPVMQHNCYANIDIPIFNPIINEPTQPETESCLNWNNITLPVVFTAQEISKYNVSMKFINTNTLPDKYTYQDIIYTKGNTYDISENQDQSVMLGIYKKDYYILYLVGGEGGVAAPTNSNFLLSGALIDEEGCPMIIPAKETTSKNMSLLPIINNYDLNNLDVSNTLSMNYMFFAPRISMDFNSYQINKDYVIDLTSWDTSKVTEMKNMFTSLASIPTLSLNLDLSHFNTLNVTNMSGMFTGVGALSQKTNLNLANFNTSNVTDMSGMFLFTGANNAEVKIILPIFDTSKVTTMESMFSGYQWLDDSALANIANFNTSSVTNMTRVFEGAFSPSDTISLDLSKWDTSKVTTMKGMFSEFGTSSTTLDLSGFNTSNVTNMDYMFSNAAGDNPIVKINNFDFTNVSNKNGIFRDMSASSKLYVKDASSQQFILNLTNTERPSTWTTDNVLINQ